MKIQSQFFVILITLQSLLFPNIAAAQQFPTCFDINNQIVNYIPDTSVQDIAIARIEMGWPVVRWNPNITNATHPETVEFFYYHECAHHALGDTLGRYGPGSERRADCWAKRTMIEVGVLDVSKYQVIRQDILQNAKPNIDFPNGWIRVQQLDSC